MKLMLRELLKPQFNFFFFVLKTFAFIVAASFSIPLDTHVEACSKKRIFRHAHFFSVFTYLDQADLSSNVK